MSFGDGNARAQCARAWEDLPSLGGGAPPPLLRLT